MPRINLPGGGFGTNLPATQGGHKQIDSPLSFRDRVNQPKVATGDRLFVAIDRSGSMGIFFDGHDNRLEAAKKAFRLFLQKSNNKREQIGLCAYDSGPEIVCEPTNSFISLEIEATKLEVSGSTAMGEALLLVLAYPIVKRVILISDGEPDNELSVDQAVTLAIEKKIPIDTIFIGSDSGADLMRSIAERTGGFFFTVDSLAVFEKTFAMLESSARLQLVDQRKGGG